MGQVNFTQYGKIFIDKIDGMSLRERALIFAASAFMLVSLTKTLLLDPLLVQQKKMSGQVLQQQERMKAIQAQVEVLQQAIRDDANSPQRRHLEQVKRQLAESDVYQQSHRDRLVEPEKIADLLEQVLNQNGRLQLMSLQTLPVAPLIDKPVKPVKPVKAAAAPADAPAEPDKQVFKHGVQMVIRGNYLDLLQYLTALEQLPSKMFWSRAELRVEKHPDAVLTLTLYTLSLDRTWLQI